MELIVWDPSFSENVEFLDKQHQMLIQIINDLYNAILVGNEKDTIEKLIGQLLTHAAMHFAREEHYFDIFGYPDTDIHKKQHKDFEKKISAFEGDFKAGRESVSKDITKFLSDWVVEHIKENDKKIGPFLNERGVQ
jgi:hemerythrin